MRWAGEGGALAVGLALFAAASLLEIVPVLPTVAIGFTLFGLGLPPVDVGIVTLLQRSTPPALQGRTYAAGGLLLGAAQTLSIGAGAALVAAVDYRLLLLAMALVMAAAAAYVLTRPEQRRAVVPEPAAPTAGAGE